MATLLLLLIIPYLVPALRRVRVLTPLSKIRYLSRIDRAHWEEQLKLRNPALAVFHFGVNEGVSARAPPPVAPAAWRDGRNGHEHQRFVGRLRRNGRNPPPPAP
jgi:hypothetical protein